jgi:hypothetical protein
MLLRSEESATLTLAKQKRVWYIEADRHVLIGKTRTDSCVHRKALAVPAQQRRGFSCNNGYGRGQWKFNLYKLRHGWTLFRWTHKFLFHGRKKFPLQTKQYSK